MRRKRAAAAAFERVLNSDGRMTEDRILADYCMDHAVTAQELRRWTERLGHHPKQLPRVTVSSIKGFASSALKQLLIARPCEPTF